MGHVIACRVLDAKCDTVNKKTKWWVNHHEGKTILNDKIDLTNTMDIQLVEDAEALFSYRDCAYRQELETNPKFEVLLKTDLWKDCVVEASATTSQPTVDRMERVYGSLRHGVTLKRIDSSI